MLGQTGTFQTCMRMVWSQALGTRRWSMKEVVFMTRLSLLICDLLKFQICLRPIWICEPSFFHSMQEPTRHIPPHTRALKHLPEWYSPTKDYCKAKTSRSEPTKRKRKKKRTTELKLGYVWKQLGGNMSSSYICLVYQ